MKRQELIHQIWKKQSFLCVGLDSDVERLPLHLKHVPDRIYKFNRAIIDATAKFCVAYKINTAFYEVLGQEGWNAMRKTIDHIPDDIFIIADAKRGDIGNTSKQYAKTFFETYPCDAITISPYMGRDSVEPFLQFENKWVILLGLTSNHGSRDFQLAESKNGDLMYEQVLKRSREWAGPDRLMYVIGATHPGQFKKIREILPEHFFLVPGVGAQGGDLEAISKYGMNDDVGLLVNSSRSIIFRGDGEDFDTHAGIAARELQLKMEKLLGVKRNV